MSTKTLSNKYKLIVKKKDHLSAEKVSQLNSEQTKVQLELLEQAFDIYNKEFEQLTLTAEDEKIDTYIEVFEEVSDIYAHTKAILLAHIHRSEEDIKQKTLPHDRNVHQLIKLPPMNIPTFDGKFEEWYSYRDQFMSIVHNNETIDDVHRMYYLKTSLQGQAAEVIATLSSTALNYKEAWSLLINRYDNKRLIVQKHLHYLLSQPVINGESTNALRNLLDVTRKHLSALKALELPVNHWDAILVHIVSNKLPNSIRQTWEIEGCKTNELPSWQNLYMFIENRIHALDIVQLKVNGTFKGKQITRTTTHAALTNESSTAQGKKSCPVCAQGYHSIYQCPTFMQATPKDRKTLIIKAKLCLNCLWYSHHTNQCSSSKVCKICTLKHHTLLHITSDHTSHITSDKPIVTNKASGEQEVQAVSTEVANNVVVHHGTTQSTTTSTTLLATALIHIHGTNGQKEMCRALLDSGSQSHFISSALAKRLHFKRQKHNVIIDGISNTTTSVREITTFDISSCTTSKQYKLNALVTPKITINLPTNKIDISEWKHINNLPLADPTFYKPGKIDLLIGAELFFRLLKTGQSCENKGWPTLQNTELGWIIAGGYELPLKGTTSENVTCHTTAVLSTLDAAVQNFWNIEEIPRINHMTKEDLVCEEHFIKTHYREKSGRYVVRLPFKEPPPTVNDSYQVAVSRFKRVERALKGQTTLWSMYKDFMYEYEHSNHMKLVQPGEQQPLIYLPHHHVCRLDSPSTKLRVVFDGSSKMNDGCSLNDRLYRGYKLQKNIVDVITHFRFPAIVFTADIRQMFRQIQVHGEDQQFQGIVWRDDPSKPLQSYKLATVTYGLITSPYHALRVLKQLALDEQDNYPIGSKILLNDFYVDEVMTGGDSLSEVLHKTQELVALLNHGGFELRKWASNHHEALKHIPSEHQIKEISLKENTDSTIKLLGINWNTTNDSFTFKAEPMKVISHLTKRELLSEIARNFDPCGWLAPLVVVAKLIMQQLWQDRLEWDDHIPQHLFNAWATHRKSFEFLNTFEVPRHIMNSTAHSTFSLHGFSDSSEKAYAAVVYIVSTQEHSAPMLLTAKTRVAPLKKMTIPRLELCGALLLAELTNALLQSININVQSINLWSDSMVTLHWIGSDPARWLTFVSNRVGQIQTLMPSAVWRYVPSADNPADVASRGSNGQELTTNQLWWNGPRWLTTPAEWPVTNHYEHSTLNLEEKTVQCSMPLLTTSNTSSSLQLLNRHSNLERLLRIVSYIIRFCRNCRPKANQTVGSGAVSERRQAMEYWIRIVQGAEFTMELISLSRQQHVRTNSQLAGLNPFLDDKGILRVGGRLKHSDLAYDMKHPIILPKNHSFTTMIINQVHLHNLHSSLSVTMTLLRQRYWIIHNRSSVKRVIHNCIKCYRFRKATCHQLMSNLPITRITPATAFDRVGVDFAGPFNVKSKLRCRTFTKSYLALFICLTTKAVHLEKVDGLSTEDFIATLRRFIARRGHPSIISSDNGTNFTGTNNKLCELYKLVQQPDHQNSVTLFCQSKEIQWKFIPPASPHHGGLWESNIKSAKGILNKVTGDMCFTAEELNTLFCQIEAILNSRPLQAVSMDTTDYSALTPGHFLIGRPLLALPEPELTEVPMNRLTRWNLIQRLQQGFWKRWTSEYLCSLQNRPKWRFTQPNLEVGDLVIVKGVQTSPTQWPLARITQLLPSPSDGQVRVVKIRTAVAELTRPITKLIKLPIKQ